MTSTLASGTPVLAALPQVPVRVGSQLKFPKNTIGPQFVNKAMPWFETFWHKNSRYPSVDEILGQYNWTVEQATYLTEHPYWKKALKSRGINPVAGAPLGAEQVAAIAVITNFNDKRSLRAKMAQINVSEEQLNGWYGNEVFLSELQIRTEKALDHAHTNVQANLLRMIDNGNFQALKFYYEITGRAKTPEELNLRSTVQAVPEAVQKYAPDAMPKIKEELELKKEMGLI